MDCIECRGTGCIDNEKWGIDVCCVCNGTGIIVAVVNNETN
jgi:DnaJ-class molecular chaperone